MNVKIQCTVKSKHADGEVTIHRATTEKKTGRLVPGLEITENEFTLKEGDHILIIYDEKTHAVPGGVGKGANIFSNSDQPGIAEGGYATGGRIDAEGNVIGGSGVGGDGLGEDKFGTAGAGHGGHAVPLVPGKTADGGSGVSGDMVKKTPDALAHQTARRK